DRLEERLVRFVAREPLLDHGPGDRRAVLERRQLVPEAWRIRAVPAECSGLVVPVGVAQGEQVARRSRVHAPLPDTLDEPVPAFERDDRPGREPILARVAADALVTGAVPRDDL